MLDSYQAPVFSSENYAARMTERKEKLKRHKSKIKPLLNTGIAEDALNAISPDVDYPTWIRVGMALKAADLSYEVFDTWSASGQKYENNCRYHWDSFSIDYGIGIGTLFYIAREHGWNGEIPKEENLTEAESTDPTVYQGIPIPERQWLVKDWMPLHATTSLYGVGGTGKSLATMGLMTAAALGEPWLGLSVMKVKSIALFCEDSPAELQRRQDDINKHHGIDFKDCGDIRWVSRVGEDNTLITFDKQGRPTPTEFYYHFEKLVLEFGAQLIIIDTAADTFSGNENDRSQVRAYISLLTKLAIKANGAVLLCAHPSRSGESSGSGDSGSTGWSNSVRSRWSLERVKPEDGYHDPNLRILKRMKANYAPKEEEILIRYYNHSFVSMVSGDHVTPDQLRIDHECRMENEFINHLRLAIEQGRNISHSSNATHYAPKLFMKACSGKGFTKREFESAMLRLFDKKLIVVEKYGRPSAPSQRLVLTEEGQRHGCS